MPTLKCDYSAELFEILSLEFGFAIFSGGFLCLFATFYGFEMKAAVVNQTITGSAKGGLYENLIATILVRRGKSLKYLRERHEPLEVEFLIEKDGLVVPIEVKASNASTASLDRLLKRDDIPVGYKLTSGNVGISGKKVTLPHYMAMFF